MCQIEAVIPASASVLSTLLYNYGLLYEDLTVTQRIK